MTIAAVIPAQAGIQGFQGFAPHGGMDAGALDSRLRGNDGGVRA